jgi:7-keto-8-aminopelargonate synthetase-like enzyme
MDAQQGTTVRLKGREMIMLASNDYLGLSFHPKVTEASRAATLKWGTSPTGARVSNGSRAYHSLPHPRRRLPVLPIEHSRVRPKM